MTIIGIILGGCVLAWVVCEVLDSIEERYEATTGRDWTTGEPK